MQCRSSPSGVWATRSPRNETRFSDRVESVTQPASHLPVVGIEDGVEDGGAVAAVLELPSDRDARNGRLGGVDAGLGLHARLLVHAPDQGVLGGIQVQAPDIAGLLPEVGVVAGHPGLDLPGLEVERRADPPALRLRDRHPMVGHLLGQRLHGPARRARRRLLGDELHEQQHVVVVIDTGATTVFKVVQAAESVLVVAMSSHAHLVIMHVDDLTDLAIGPSIGGHQHDARSLGHSQFHGARTSPQLEERAVTPA
jgi:hypothetical protein